MAVETPGGWLWHFWFYWVLVLVLTYTLLVRSPVFFIFATPEFFNLEIGCQHGDLGFLEIVPVGLSVWVVAAWSMLSKMKLQGIIKKKYKYKKKRITETLKASHYEYEKTIYIHTS